MNDEALDQVKLDYDIMRDLIINKLKATMTGLGSYYLGRDSVYVDENKLRSLIEMMLYNTTLLRQRKPINYWRMFITAVLEEMQESRIDKIKLDLQYNGAEQAVAEALIGDLLIAMTGNAHAVDVAVLMQFMWQVKRKLNRLPTTYHIMPIFWGKGGSGKSETLKSLFSPLKSYVYTGMSFAEIGDSRFYEALSNNLIVFLDEMPKIERSSVETVKSVITADVLTYRVMREHQYKKAPQRCTFIGTSNESPSALIKDTTGMRRFHYIECLPAMNFARINGIDWEYLWKCINENREHAYTKDLLNDLSIRQEATRQRNSVELFLEEGILEHVPASVENAEVRVKDVYEVYRSFCKECGYSPFNRKNFTDELVQRYKFVIETRSITKTQRVSFLKAKLNVKSPDFMPNSLNKLIKETSNVNS